MPAEADNPGRPDKLSIVVHSGAFDKVHYALVMASAAVATDQAVTLFFTMGACRALLNADGAGNPGWHGLGATERGATAADTDRAYGERGVATFDELLSACRDLGARFIVCEMGLRAMDLERGDLRGDVPVDLVGVVTFLADASEDGAVLFI